MKLKLSQLKDNPFHRGEIDKEQVELLKINMKELGLMGSLPVFKRDNDYCLVYGHHRREAAIQLFGKNYETEVTIQEFSDDEAVRGMAIENLTQTKDPKKRIKELVNIRDYLKKAEKEDVKTAVRNRDSSLLKDGRKKGKQHIQEVGSVRHISEWLNKNGEVVPKTEVARLLRINDKLDPKLFDQITYGEANEKGEAGKKMNLTNADILSSFDDIDEQNRVWKALQKTRENRGFRVRTREKLVTNYKALDDDEVTIGYKNEKDKKTGKIKKKAVKRKKEEHEKKIDKTIKEEIKAGKRDIADAKSRAFIPEYQPTILELKADLIEGFSKLGMEMQRLKPVLNKLSKSELELTYYFLAGWCKKELAPFVNAIIEELHEKDLRFEINANDKKH